MNQRNRKVDKSTSIKTLYDDLLPLFDSSIKAPTTLMELSKKQYERFKDQCIHMTGIHMNKDNSNNQSSPSYHKATYGRAISKTNKKIDFGNSGTALSYQCINLMKTTSRYVMITSSKKECLTMFPGTSCYSIILTNKGNVKDISSGIVLLMLAVLPEDKLLINAKKWDSDMISLINSCKKDVLPTYDHHGTRGKCFSFGNKPE